MSAEGLLDAPIGPDLPPAWRWYRDGFAVLQHIQALTSGPERRGVHVPALARDLGFAPEQAESVVDYLVMQGYLAYTRPGIEVVLAPEGVAYLAAGAGRRRSVRPRFASTRPCPPSVRERAGRVAAPTRGAWTARGGVLRWAVRWLEDRLRGLRRSAGASLA